MINFSKLNQFLYLLKMFLIFGFLFYCKFSKKIKILKNTQLTILIFIIFQKPINFCFVKMFISIIAIEFKILNYLQIFQKII